MQIHNRGLVLLLSALFVQLGGAAAPHHVTAQEGSSAPIFFALPEAYPDVDGRVLLLREPGREIIVLAQAATPEDLAVALNMLHRFRRERGQPEQGRGHMVPIVGYAPLPTLAAEERARLQASLDDLRARPLANVGSLGRGRWMHFDER